MDRKVSSGGLYRSIKMSQLTSDIIVGTLSVLLILFIAIAIMLSL